jgi:hypothetical protein
MKDLYRPHFIRRTKKEIFTSMSSELSVRELNWNELPYKTDIVVWIPLTDIQKTVYHMIVSSKAVEDSAEGLDKKHIFVMI